MKATHSSQITTYQSDGSDGYSPGTWGYLLYTEHGMYTDGGWSSRSGARDAARKRAP